MPCEDTIITETILQTAIQTALSGPKKASSDAGSVEMHSLKDLIEISRYQNSRCAATGGRRGLRFTQIVAPGTV